MTIPDFIITKRLHPDCDECNQCAQEAAAFARVTGSIGGTTQIEMALEVGTTLEHSATVERKKH